MCLCVAHRRTILTNKRKVFERDETLHLKAQKKRCVSCVILMFLCKAHRTYNPNFDFGAIYIYRRSSALVLCNSFLLIDAIDRNKISSNQKRLFFAVSLYPLSFFENTPGLLQTANDFQNGTILK